MTEISNGDLKALAAEIKLHTETQLKPVHEKLAAYQERFDAGDEAMKANRAKIEQIGAQVTQLTVEAGISKGVAKVTARQQAKETSRWGVIIAALVTLLGNILAFTLTGRWGGQ